MAEQVISDRRAAGRWHARHGAALILRIAAGAIPVALSIVAACVVARWVGPQELGVLGWVLPGVVALVVVFLSERLCRRMLPLAGLLKLTMAFPDQAPSRLSIALRTGTVRQLRKWIEELEATRTDLTAAGAAERVLTLAAALNAHDHRTRGHSERVRALTDLVSKDMGLDQHDADRLRWAALLHDIGKLAVPAAILNKPKAPDAREWAILQRHPEEGARLVGPLASWLGEWASAVDSHHEKFDGTGYPRGLAGSEIPIAGRIVAVTDSFETMTAVRSYKRAMSFGDARAELQRCAGTHFDPAVVRVMYGISLPRLLGALGPLAALGHIPLVALLAQGSSVVPVIGEAAKTAALAGAASVALTGVVALQPVTTAGAAPAGSATPAAASQPQSSTTAPSSSAISSIAVASTVASNTTTPQPVAAPADPVAATSEVPDRSTAAPTTTVATGNTGTSTIATTVTPPTTLVPPTTLPGVKPTTSTTPTTPTVDLDPVLDPIDPVVTIVDGVIGDITSVTITTPPLLPPVEITLPDVSIPEITLPRL